jgi:hypothetical protein
MNKLPRAVQAVFQRPTGWLIKVVMPAKTVKRLSTTCFRGKDKSLAGNFKLWNSFDEMLRDCSFCLKLLEHLDALCDNREFEGTYSFGIDYPQRVGWSSTALAAGQVPSDALVKKRLGNNGASALFYKDPNALAPATSEITVICELRMEGAVETALVHSLYPGPDVGELEGNMTKTTGRVWYAWDNPGTPEPVHE